jgi:PPOX class F420-dependent enzyme/OxyR family protein
MLGNEHAERPHPLFTEAEAQYLAEDIIDRVATCSPSGHPDVVQVQYRFDGSAILFGGASLRRTRRSRNMMANNRVASVADDFASAKPMRVRGVEVRESAKLAVGKAGVMMVRAIPLNIRSWGLGD